MRWLALLIFPAAALSAADADYRIPPGELVELVDTPRTPSVSPSPDGENLVILERHGLPSVADLARPELRLAGLRIDPRNSGRSRISPYKKPALLDIRTGEKRVVAGPADDARFSPAYWSADGEYFAFFEVKADRWELWIADVGDARAMPVSGLRLNAPVPGPPCAWESNHPALICRAAPAGRGAAPTRPGSPIGPEIQETTGERAAARTYQDLLKTAYDEDLFEHHLQTQLVRVTIEGKVSTVGDPDLITRADPSPDGRFLLVETLHRPFSRIVPMRSFGRRVEIWDHDGSVLAELADRGPDEQRPIDRDSATVGPREHGWRADAAATVYWVEALDGGMSSQAADERDAILELAAPFTGEPQTIATLGYRFDNIHFTADGVAFIASRWWRTRRERMWMLPTGGGDLLELFDRSSEDRYGDPGLLVETTDARGSRVVMTDGKAVFFRGRGASEEGDRPFFDRFDLAAKKADRLWRAEGEEYEYPTYVLSPDRLITSRETPDVQPNYYVRDLARGQRIQLTHFPHPHPQLEGATKRMLRYTRDDGVELTATLHLPPGYEPSDGPLPMLMWAYPREYKDAAAAAQVSGSPYEFAYIDPTGSPLFWLTQGYAILDDPTMPIVGEGGAEPNDTYVKQLVASAKAAVDEVVRLGFGDRERIGIGGHSYGAFMTANLLAHSNLFQTGIAQSGAYNRTLTPFGFQAEERTYWQAPEIYYQMSPFMHADKVDEPILMVHGMADNNSGTFPIQSERFFRALKGHGAQARLVMLPHESHVYQARESILHLMWEKTVWLDRYVKKQEMTRADR